MRWSGQRGFTLVEVLVGTALLGTLTTLLAAGLFQMVTAVEKGGAAFEAQTSTRNAFSWLARDMHTARSTNLVDGFSPVSDATFHWTDPDGAAPTDHTVSYTLVQGELVRTYDGSASVIGRRIASITFSRAARLVTVNLATTPRTRFKVTNQETLAVRLRSNE